MKTYWIKKHIVIISLLLTALCILGYLAATVSEQSLFLFHSSFESVEPTLKSFQRKYKPKIELNFSELYGSSGQFQILHPLLDMRNLKFQKLTPTCNLDTSTQSNGVVGIYQFDREEAGFQTPSGDIFSGRKLTKFQLFNHFIYEGVLLPNNFLTTPPFIDDWGNSYAYLLERDGPPSFKTKTWVEQHLSFFKVSELSELFSKYQIEDSQYSVISKFNDLEIEEIIRAAPLVMSKDFLLLKNQSHLGFSPLSYWVYDIRELQAELKEGKYELTSFTDDSLCLQKMGNGCWTYNSKHTMAYLYRYSLVILLLFVLIIFTILCFYFNQLYKKNKAQQKNRLALQVLSHEFRTPVSSMLLMLEQLTRNQAHFSIADQDLITRTSTEVFRLQRIIEISKTYLQTESHRVRFKYIDIPSINNWICDFVLESNQDVQFQLLPVDQIVTTDPFWLKFVLSNLVENAFNHGKPPVIIRLCKEKNQIKICVEDHGQCEFNSLSEMTSAFTKSGQSKGMGLGLNITKFILDDWGTEIQFSQKPTAFTLFLNE